VAGRVAIARAGTDEENAAVGMLTGIDKDGGKACRPSIRTTRSALVAPFEVRVPNYFREFAEIGYRMP